MIVKQVIDYDRAGFSSAVYWLASGKINGFIILAEGGTRSEARFNYMEQYAERFNQRASNQPYQVIEL